MEVWELPTSMLNNNMRCFEIWEYDDEDNLIGMVKQ